ncbi:hypothetical protein PF003_g15439 [Phytophthora fragariae]|nr:hypothetical protein PF003_g15439 [Phytophthora fragariae]
MAHQWATSMVMAAVIRFQRCSASPSLQDTSPAVSAAA